MKPNVDQVIDRMGELGNDRSIRSDDFENFTKLCESEDNLRWIWRKGVSLGKKMVVTGVVVSSAPFALPPLMALSAIGFAVSLPAGFVFATYACTDKLMNALLPMPSWPPYLESGAMSSDEEEYGVDDDGEVDKGYEEEDDDDTGLQENDIGAQEKEFEEDARNEFEKRIELGEEDDRDIRDDNCVVPVNEDEQGARMSVAEIVEESGNEDVGEYMDAEEQILDSTTITDTVEGIRETDDDISLIETGVIENPEDHLGKFVVEAEFGGINENNAEQADEQVLGSTAIHDLTEGIGETDYISSIEREVVENPEDYLGDFIAEAELGGINENNAEQAEEQVLGSTTIQNNMEGIRETDENISLIERDVVKNPEDSLGESIVVAELGEIKVKNAEQPKEQVLDSTTIPDTMEGIRETDDGISFIERRVAENQEDYFGIKENNAEQIADELAFVLPMDAREENRNTGNLADIDDNELRNETTRLLEQIRDEGRDDHGQQDSPEKGICLENEQNGESQIKDMPQERGEKNLPVIPEEVPVSIVGSDEVRKAVNERSEKNETENAQEQAELVIERMLVVNVETSVDHTDTDIHRGTADERIETLIVSNVVAVETADESRFDDKTEVPHKLTDLLPKGEDLPSQTGGVDVSFGYHEICVELVPESNHAETGLDQESTADSNKEMLTEEKIWEQIHAIRTVVGYKSVPNASCVEELKALYGFTGVELPVLSTDAGDLTDINEKLNFLMAIVGVK